MKGLVADVGEHNASARMGEGVFYSRSHGEDREVGGGERGKNVSEDVIITVPTTCCYALLT
jgi:hypothetical protein